VTLEDPPVRLVTEVIPEETSFGSTWVYTIQSDGPGVLIIVEERVRVCAELHRLILRWVIGHHRSLDSYLTALGGYFGERVTPVHGE
jgi:hypothetical protein